MVDEVGVVKGLRGYGIKKDIAHTKVAKPRRGSGRRRGPQRPNRVGVKADKYGYGRPGLGGPIGYVGLGVILFFMVGFQEEEIMIKKNGLALRMS
jgi:hypothetical protein